MALNSPIQVALLSIQPRFTRLIFTGKKKVEFRKVRFHRRVSDIVIYASRPVQKIIGYFEVSYVDESSPRNLWKCYGSVGGIAYEEFQEYYADSALGVAIGIGEVFPIPSAIPLSELGMSLSAPQNFMYLANEAVEELRQHIHVSMGNNELAEQQPFA